MDKKILLKVFISILVVAIIIVIVLLYVLNKEEISDIYSEITDKTEKTEEDVEEEINIDIEMVQDRDMFYTVANCVQNYLNYITDKNSEVIYNLLDNDYKERMDINAQNVLNIITQYDNYQVFRPKKMYQTELDQSSTIFLVYGTIRDEIPLREMSITERQENDFYLAVNIDYGENIFTVIPDGFISTTNLDYTVNMKDVNIEVLKCENYIDKCEIIMQVNNNSSNAINIMDMNINLEYEEEEKIDSEGINENISKILNEEEQIVNAGEERKIRVTFENSFKSPKQLTIYDETNNEDIVIPISI